MEAAPSERRCFPVTYHSFDPDFSSIYAEKSTRVSSTEHIESNNHVKSQVIMPNITGREDTSQVLQLLTILSIILLRNESLISAGSSCCHANGSITGFHLQRKQIQMFDLSCNSLYLSLFLHQFNNQACRSVWFVLWKLCSFCTLVAGGELMAWTSYTARIRT